MKPYEKPKLIALSLSGSSALCASCVIDAKGPNMDPSFQRALKIMDWYDPGKQSAITGVFTTDDAGCALKVEGYCKYVPDGRIVINS